MTLRAFLFALSSSLAACQANVDVLSPTGSGLDETDAGGGRGGAATMLDGSPSGAVTYVTAAFADTCAIAGGALFCWGTSTDGRVVVTPERIDPAGPADFVEVSGGNRVHCTVRGAGGVACWGANDEGQLGQGDRNARELPTRVTLPARAEHVRGKWGSFCATLVDGSLSCWGANEEGQIAQGDPFPDPGPDALLPKAVGSERDFVSSDSGQGHACAIGGPGELHCWGRNGMGELGLGAGSDGQIRYPVRVGTDSDWTRVAAGQGHTCGIRERGLLYCWGDGSSGQLGLGDLAGRDVPTQVGSASDFTDVAVDTFHGCAIRAPGELYCWGRNVEGQLGLGDVQDRTEPTRVGAASDWVQVSVGRFHTCGLRADGTAYCMGDNPDGRLGTGDVERRDTPTPVSFPGEEVK